MSTTGEQRAIYYCKRREIFCTGANERGGCTASACWNNSVIVTEEETVKQGKWYAYDRYSQWLMHYQCSECHAIALDSYNYCPNCGAKMKKEIK